MKKQKTSLIVTLLNEEGTILSFLASVRKQTVKPDEVIIVDGGSNDKTVEISKTFAKTNPDLHITIRRKKGNRSVGRNEAVRISKGALILCTDAGCILDKKWVEEIQKPFAERSVDVVAGYYRGDPKTVFQKCLIPYVLVMEDKVRADSFLPATRSLAFRRKVWEEICFPEEYSHNEDYVFANRLRMHKKKIAFARKAIVNWIPRSSLTSSFWMFFRFAYGDAEARLFRVKVLFIFIRYLIAIAIFFLAGYYQFLLQLWFVLISFIAYGTWAIMKNYKYVRDLRAFFYLPLLQYVSDAAVLSGTTAGFFHRASR